MSVLALSVMVSAASCGITPSFARGPGEGGLGIQHALEARLVAEQPSHVRCPEQIAVNA